MFVRLSLGSFWLAALAAGLALIAPVERATVLTGIALAGNLLAYAMWRFQLGARRAAHRTDMAVPAPCPLSDAALTEAAERVMRHTTTAASFHAALLEAARILKSELGAREARAYAVQALDERDVHVAEVIEARSAFLAAPRALRLRGSVVGRAVLARRSVLASPEAIGLPVSRDGQVIAVLELLGLQIDIEPAALGRLLDVTGSALVQRATAHERTAQAAVRPEFSDRASMACVANAQANSGRWPW